MRRRMRSSGWASRDGGHEVLGHDLFGAVTPADSQAAAVKATSAAVRGRPHEDVIEVSTDDCTTYREVEVIPAVLGDECAKGLRQLVFGFTPPNVQTLGSG